MKTHKYNICNSLARNRIPYHVTTQIDCDQQNSSQAEIEKDFCLYISIIMVQMKLFRFFSIRSNNRKIIERFPGRGPSLRNWSALFVFWYKIEKSTDNYRPSPQ